MAYDKEYYDKNKEYFRNYRKEYYKKYKDRIDKYNKEYYKKAQRRKRIRISMLKSKYGITLEQYNSMCKEQNNLCAICSKAETRKIRNKKPKLSVDHDHKTGKVRGLLCSKCNSQVGWYEKCREKVESYLKSN